MSEYDEPVDHADDDLTGDDLASWADADLVRALRAPGSDSELADEEQFLAAFRESAGTGSAGTPSAGDPRKVSRLSARRLAAGGTAVVIVALSGGVAAAYTGNLPDPVQQFAHTVIGAPAPEPESPATAVASPHKARRSPSAPASSTSVSPSAPGSGPSPSPSSAPSTHPSSHPSESPSSGPSSQPSPSVDPSPSPSTSPSNPPPPPPPPPAAVSLSASSHLVGYGSTLALSGQLVTADGTPVAGHKIALQMRGAGGWSVVLRTVTDDSGYVTTQSQPVTGLQRYRWRTGRVHSALWRVRVEPTISASSDPGAATTTISASSVGAAPGDLVELYTLVKGQPTLVAQTTVNDSGGASFQVPTPKHRRVFVVRLVPTADHVGAKARTVVIPPPAVSSAPTGSPTPTP